ncbi:Hypothetical predicted protein [Octopus vulgaris]|uniref:Uncharacterized protein n=1 Tax=Octopus vulgaris TaxID=6645 RepID=A0AA36AWV1_OCTVU|nr:Hypothetical predicted protein [Octopus vulgaris]
MSSKHVSAEEAQAQILCDDLDESDYCNKTDFEQETSEESPSNSDSDQDCANGYIVNAEVYTGLRPDARAVDNLGATGNLVRITEGPELFTDRFYTSVEVAEYL